jgi:hypothetical protein
MLPGGRTMSSAANSPPWPARWRIFRRLRNSSKHPPATALGLCHLCGARAVAANAAVSRTILEPGPPPRSPQRGLIRRRDQASITRQPQATPWRQVPEMGSALPPDRGVRRLVRSAAALRWDGNKSTGQRA